MLGRRLTAWIAAIYVGSGMPLGLIGDALPVYLRQEGLSYTAIGLLGMVQLPWSAKLLWAPWVDRYGSTRRWLGGALALMAGALIALAVAVGTGAPALAPLSAACLALTFAAATQDLAVDAYFVREVPDAAIGAGNGVRMSAYRAGMVLGGGTVVLLAARAGWPAALMVPLGLALALALASRWLPQSPRGARPPLADWLQALWRWAERGGGLGVVAFLLLYRLGDALIAPMVKPFWVDRGLSAEEIWLATTVLGIGLTVLGAVLGAAYTARAGTVRGLVVLGIVQAASNLGYAAVAACDAGHTALMLAIAVESLGQGLGNAAQLALVTRLCEREHAATQFAALSALFAVTRIIAGALGGIGVDAMGPAAYFACTCAAALPAFALVPQVARRLRLDAGSVA